MQRYAAKISFVGTAYHGWQIQPNAISVQERLEEAMSLLWQEKVSVVGCGRTDAGVHATDFILHFDLQKSIPKADWVYKLNAILPSDIACKELIWVNSDFHARFDAISRTYEYHCHFGKAPFKKDRSMQLMSQPNLQLMNQAMKYFLGKKDFTSMAKLHGGNKTNICEVFEANWSEADGAFVLTISANRFLRNMVRAIVGTALEIGLGKHPPEYVKEVLALKDRSAAGNSVKACGLYLTEIKYPESK